MVDGRVAHLVSCSTNEGCLCPYFPANVLQRGLEPSHRFVSHYLPSPTSEWKKKLSLFPTCSLIQWPRPGTRIAEIKSWWPCKVTGALLSQSVTPHDWTAQGGAGMCFLALFPLSHACCWAPPPFMLCRVDIYRGKMLNLHGFLRWYGTLILQMLCCMKVGGAEQWGGDGEVRTCKHMPAVPRGILIAWWNQMNKY